MRTHLLLSRKYRKALCAHSSRIAYDRFVRLNNDLKLCDDNLIANQFSKDINATINL